MALRLNGATSGYVEIDAPATAGSNTIVLPSGNGSANQALVTDGSGALSWSDCGRMTLATALNSTSGTSIDFTGIPSWVKRVTVMFNGVSTNGTSPLRLQLGTSSGVVTTGYNCCASVLSSGVVTAAYTSGIVLQPVGYAAAAYLIYGNIFISSLGSNIWSVNSMLCAPAAPYNYTSAEGNTLSGTLDRIRISTVNGTDAFDAGSINILYEG